MRKIINKNHCATNLKSCLSGWLKRIETLHPKKMELGLDRVQAVAEKLKLLPWPGFVITVTGTNGKGSCVALLEAICLAAGHATGAYFSPHLLRYNERIHINGQEASDAAICQALQAIDTAREDVHLTYFEFTTLAALWLFRQANVSLVVLEVGLGGRLDATNIVDADIAVITHIALDHQRWLGETRAAIAREKAGIMRPKKPVVCGDLAVPTPITDHAKALAAPLFLLQRDFFYQIRQATWVWQDANASITNLPLPALPLQNAAIVLKVVALLPSHLQVRADMLRSGLARAFLPGRFQVMRGRVDTILDVAHNPDSAALLATNLRARSITGKTIAVFSMLKDKDIAGSVELFTGLISTWHIAPLTGGRACDVGVLAASLHKSGYHQIIQHADIATAYQAALNMAQFNDRVVVFGSFLSVAEVMQAQL